ncbi:MAG TPA: SIS domain-containing protein [Candidatus Angelobacter sp.]
MTKGPFTSYMLKEIFEQPDAVRRTVLAFQSNGSNSITFAGANRIAPILTGVSRILITASGTSRHAGMVGSFMLESMTGLPVELDFASEFQHSPARIGAETLVVVISQSGQTGDTLASLRKAKAAGASVVAVSNVANSSIMREADAQVETKAGPEVAIPSTKAFTAQMAALYLFSLWLAERKGRLSQSQAQAKVAETLTIPEKLNLALDAGQAVFEISQKYLRADSFLFAGRGIHYPIALDGALKLKEVAYVHAEGFPLGEIKHGPLAMIDESVVTVVLLTCDSKDAESVIRYEKSLATTKEIKERGSRIIALASEGDSQAAAIADDILLLPRAPEMLLPIIEIVPLQLLAHHLASLRGNNVDRPRSLVKSVLDE